MSIRRDFLLFCGVIGVWSAWQDTPEMYRRVLLEYEAYEGENTWEYDDTVESLRCR